jgi:hypothetical protein
MSDDNNGNTVRRIAHDSASDSVPIGLTQEPDFDQWCSVVQEIADDIERQIRQA